MNIVFWICGFLLLNQKAIQKNEIAWPSQSVVFETNWKLIGGMCSGVSKKASKEKKRKATKSRREFLTGKENKSVSYEKKEG